MCKYCEGHAPLIQTGVTADGLNFDVGIYKNHIVCESRYTDSFGITETKAKEKELRFCPMCGRKIQGKRYSVTGFWIHPHKDSVAESLNDLTYDEAMAVLKQWRNDNIHKNVYLNGEDAIKS